MQRDVFCVKCTFHQRYPMRGAACWSSPEITVSRQEGAGTSHRVAYEQEEIDRYCQRGATHLVLPATGIIKTLTLLTEPQLLLLFTVAMETPDLFTPSAVWVMVVEERWEKGEYSEFGFWRLLIKMMHANEGVLESRRTAAWASQGFLPQCSHSIGCSLSKHDFLRACVLHI